MIEASSLLQLRGFAAALESSLASTGHNELGAAFSAEVPLTDLVRHYAILPKSGFSGLINDIRRVL